MKPGPEQVREAVINAELAFEDINEFEADILETLTAFSTTALDRIEELEKCLDKEVTLINASINNVHKNEAEYNTEGLLGMWGRQRNRLMKALKSGGE